MVLSMQSKISSLSYPKQNGVAQQTHQRPFCTFCKAAGHFEKTYRKKKPTIKGNGLPGLANEW